MQAVFAAAAQTVKALNAGFVIYAVIFEIYTAGRAF